MQCANLAVLGMLDNADPRDLNALCGGFFFKSAADVYRACALYSILIANRGLRAFYSAGWWKKGYDWSMMSGMVGRNAEALNQNYDGAAPFNIWGEPYSWRRTEWMRSTIHLNDEDPCQEVVL